MNRATSVGRFSSRRRDEYNMKTSKNISAPARSFLVITEKKNGHYYVPGRVLSEKIDRGVRVPRACEFREGRSDAKFSERRYF